jgi:hypothetical protein
MGACDRVLQQGEEQPKCCAKARGFALERSVGRHVYSIVDRQGHPLDMDVVDTTFLDANVQVVCLHCPSYLNVPVAGELQVLTRFVCTEEHDLSFEQIKI